MCASMRESSERAKLNTSGQTIGSDSQQIKARRLKVTRYLYAQHAIKSDHQDRSTAAPAVYALRNKIITVHGWALASANETLHISYHSSGCVPYMQL